LPSSSTVFFFPKSQQVALGYKQLHNKDIEKIPVPLLQKNGFLFIWVINARYAFALDLMEKWGYRFSSLT